MSSSSDKVETIAEKHRREWEEKKIVYRAERRIMVAEDEERRKARKVTVTEASRIRETEDAKGLAYNNSVPMTIYMNDPSSVCIEEPPARKQKEEGDGETKRIQNETRKRRLKILRARPFVCLTWSQMQDYNKRVKESGGFDVGDIPYNTIPEGVPVRPIDLGRFPKRLVMIENLSSFAIEDFNEREKTEYQFQKVLKANLCWASLVGYRGFYYYITFQVKDITCSGSSPLNFQAKVYYFEGDTKVSGGQQACPPITKVLSCRPEP